MTMMKYRKIEVAVLNAKRTHNIDQITDIKNVLEHRKRMLDMKIDSIPTSKMTFEDDSAYAGITEEYSQINRLFRIMDAYAWS